MGIWVVIQLIFSCAIKLIIYKIIIMKGYRPNINRFLLWSFLHHWSFWWRQFNFYLYTCVVFFRVTFFRVVFSEISKVFLSILYLARRARSAEISSTFKQSSWSLPDIFFLEVNYKGVKTNFYELTRLSCLWWSIICRMDEFAWGFQVLLVVLCMHFVLYACCIFHVVFLCCMKLSLHVLCSCCMRLIKNPNKKMMCCIAML